jgi:hypothetical protein
MCMSIKNHMKIIMDASWNTVFSEKRTYFYLFVGAKNVMLLTTTTPILGKTWDDNSFKPAVYKRYDYRLDGTLFLLVCACIEYCQILKFPF